MMTRRMRIAAVLLAAAACGAADARSGPTPSRRQLGRYDLAAPDLTTATATRVTLPPGLRSGRHRHPGPVIAYVVSGTVRVQVGGGAVRDYRAGETVLEPAGEIIDRFDNASSRLPATFVAVYLAGADAGPLVVPVR